MTDKLAIIAGRGPVPKLIIAACLAEKRAVYVVAINGETEPDCLAAADHSWHDIAAVGGILDTLKNTGCVAVCLIGPIERPDFKKLRPDFKGIRLLPKIIAAARRGDDAILRVVVKVFEDAGIQVVGAEEVLRSLAITAGDLTAQSPDDADMADIARGLAVIGALGRLDIGQAVVIREGRVLAVEAAEGTDEMLHRCRKFRGPKPAGVLVKLPKPGQERRVDLPAIGLTTLDNVIAAGLKGIALEAGGALLLDRPALITQADAAGLFVHAVGPQGSQDDRDRPA